MEEVPLADRPRLRNYLRKRPLGLDIITEGPSAPSDVTVENFAFRLDQITFSITNRLNSTKQSNCTTRTHCKLIVRGYRIDGEIDAFFSLLQSPYAGDRALPDSVWEEPRPWELHLSLEFWLLAILHSPVVRSLRPGDSPGLYQMRDDIDRRKKLKRLRAVARRDISWPEYKRGGGQLPVSTIGALLIEILRHAGIVCTTPTMSCSKQDPYLNLKNELVKGVAVDDAGSISRPDLYSVWGNTLLPCLLAGDNYSIAPAAEGDFEHTEYELGRKLELYLTNKYLDWAPVVSNTFYEVFIHCEGSYCHVNQTTGSKQNPVQFQVALSFVTGFVNCKGADPSDIIIITPDKANVDLVGDMRKGSDDLMLSGMKPVTIIEDFQGCEGKIVVAILGVIQAVGPQDLAENRLLAAMLSRSTCGLFIVGDINTLGVKNLSDDFSGYKAKRRKKRAFYTPSFMLRNVLKRVIDTGRVIRV
ncbi:Hypothetical protein NCS54_00388100 [Fusarium falciforme]|uniref:Hypothetical protein n=1 Tax=Fusarium falciforme TaxID=195108 RepID=UPI002300CEBB|nr:Hypothetical protein NCS54_00388100 [Fusarium falciforme]WAO86601.1 Hypothetical protein NCS54_00388100 [Fusarium falciforme]